MTQRSPVETREVEAGEDGMRLDRWFKSHYADLPHSRLEKLLRTGQVRVDGGRAKASTRLAAGQSVRVPPLPAAPASSEPAQKGLTKAERAFLASITLYEDDDLLVLNKPPGIAVQGGTKTTHHIDRLLEGLSDNADGARRYDYFKTLHPNPLDRQPTWVEIVTVIDWLLAAPDQRARAHLVVEFAAVLMHHLSRMGQHGRRLSLALTAADIAQEMERRTIEGWLRSDAIPWTLMEHYHDPAAARTHLVRGLSLAKELKNRDMQALALTFLGRVSLITGDNRTARANLDHARRLDPSPAVQTRIAWIEGDLAQRKKHYDEALGKYRAAAETDAGSSGGHHTTITPLLRLGDLYYKLSDPAAKGTYTTLLDTMRPALTGRRLAQVKFSLARVARLEGEIGRAQALVTEAGQALATADDDPQFRQVLALFAANLPA